MPIVVSLGFGLEIGFGVEPPAVNWKSFCNLFKLALRECLYSIITMEKVINTIVLLLKRDDCKVFGPSIKHFDILTSNDEIKCSVYII